MQRQEGQPRDVAAGYHLTKPECANRGEQIDAVRQLAGRLVIVRSREGRSGWGSRGAHEALVESA